MGIMKMKMACPHCGETLTPNAESITLNPDDGGEETVCNPGEAYGCGKCDFFVVASELPSFKDMLKAKFKK